MESYISSDFHVTTNAPLPMTTAAPAQQGPKPLAPSISLQQQRMPQQSAQQNAGLRTPLNRKTIYDRNLNRTRTAELSRASFAYLFGEMVGYAQKSVTGIQDLERRYALRISLSLFTPRQKAFSPQHTLVFGLG